MVLPTMCYGEKNVCEADIFTILLRENLWESFCNGLFRCVGLVDRMNCRISLQAFNLQ